MYKHLKCFSFRALKCSTCLNIFLTLFPNKIWLIEPPFSHSKHMRIYFILCYNFEWADLGRRADLGRLETWWPATRAPVLPGEPVTSCWRCCFVKNNFQYEFNEFIVRVILASHQLNIESFGERSEICLDNDKCWLIKLIMDSEQSPSSILR